MKRIIFSVLSVLMLIGVALPANVLVVLAGECTETMTINTTHTAWVDSENPTEQNMTRTNVTSVLRCPVVTVSSR